MLEFDKNHSTKGHHQEFRSMGKARVGWGFYALKSEMTGKKDGAKKVAFFEPTPVGTLLHLKKYLNSQRVNRRI